MIRVGIVTNPMNPSTWEDHEVEDVRELLVRRFPSWPSTAKIYDLEGIGDWTRAAHVLDPIVLSRRDVTPHDEAGVERLGELRGPVLVIVPPADPLTAIFAVVAIAVGVAAAFLFLPRIPTNTQRPQSPNNSLTSRTNQPRLNGRVADIFGTVESTPDLLAVPYVLYQNNLQVEVSYMALGRGSYDVSRVRDGDTAIASIAGSSAAIYAPFTSPNSGDAPQLQIGPAIAEPVLSVVKLNEVNGQTLKPSNVNRVQGEDNIRFVYPDSIQANGGVGFTETFSTGDAIQVSNADISGDVGTDTTTQDARFTSSGTIVFSSFDPRTLVSAGDPLTVDNAGFVNNETPPSTVDVGWPAISATGSDAPGSYTIIFTTPAGAAGRVSEVTIGTTNPGTYKVHVVTMAGNVVTIVSTTTITLVAGVNTVPLNITVAAGQYVGIEGAPGGAYKFQNSVNPLGISVWAKGSAIASGDNLGAPATQHRFEASVKLSLGTGNPQVFVDLAGTYTVASVNVTTITLTSPASVNSDWSKLTQFAGNTTGVRSVNFSTPTATSGVNLNGSYTIASVSSDTIVLNNPALVNAAWNNLDDLPGGATAYVSPSLSRNSESWIGPFIVDLDEADEVLANFVGIQGLYTLSKKKGKQAPVSVTVELEVTPVNINDAAIGPAETFTATLTGDSKERTAVGTSLRASPTSTGRCAVRARRTSPTPEDDDYGAVVDEVKWEACYGLAPVTQEEFGDMTTVHTRTIATPGALAVKERKLNMRVTRRLPQRISGSTFGALAATDSVADIIAAMCLDPYIGRRSPDEVDFDSIYDTVAEVVDYFGAPEAGEFGYTFDDTDVSFEETLATVASSIFCRAYRQGRVIRLTFERATENSTLIFNARNTIPGSQSRTVRFGPLDDHDGVELDYTDPVDGAALTFSIPQTGLATSPRSLEVVGVRSYLLAYWQAWRAWNKVRFQNIAVELEATQEASLVLPQDRVLIADRTRPGVLQGEVEAEDGTTLTLSEPAELVGDGWTIFLQHVDGTVEALGVTAGSSSYEVELTAAPRMALSVDAENFARATYIIVPDDDVQARAFLVSEREPNSNFTETVRAVNYSFLYYQHDELTLWLDGEFSDAGPFGHQVTPTGGITLVNDTSRGQVYRATANTQNIALPGVNSPASYTKAAWARMDASSAAGNILSAPSTTESFGFNGSGAIGAGHGGGLQVSAPIPPAGEWHHIAATYDADDQELALYLDGLEVDRAGSIARGSIGELAAFSNLVGRLDDVRLWKRALTATELRRVYLGSKAA